MVWWYQLLRIDNLQWFFDDYMYARPRLSRHRPRWKKVECWKNSIIKSDNYQGIRTIYPPLIILSRDYFVEIVLLDCKISGTISPKSAISSFYSAQISRISTKCYFFRHLGRTGRKCTYYFYQETISTFYYVKIHTISPKYNFYLLFSIEIRKDHAVKGETNCMKLYLKGARSAPKFFEILFLPS